MKISIGKKNDKKVESCIQSNVLMGHTVFFDGEEYYCEVLNHNNIYISPDILIPINQRNYQYINGHTYDTDENV
jgi:hypothetical protein